MSHQPIILKNLSLNFAHKICFEDFSTVIYPYERIGIIGSNGSGKTSLLRMIHDHLGDIFTGYVPQIIDNNESLSGSQRFHASLNKALAIKPDVLLLDEPTNHLDANNRKSLMRMIDHFPGTVIIISHDLELLRTRINTLWHIDAGKVTVFQGTYDDYNKVLQNKKHYLEKELHELTLAKKDVHYTLMQEQARSKKSKLRGEKNRKENKWPTLVAGSKKRQEQETSGRKSHDIHNHKQNLEEKLKSLVIPEVISPKFSINARDVSDTVIINVQRGIIGYNTPLIKDIYFSMGSKERIAITGNNGCGKTTFIKALLNDPTVIKSGEWYTPQQHDIGYLDQHYRTLPPEVTVLESIELIASHWSHPEIRCHLNDFLFRKNEEIHTHVKNLSGG